MNANLLKKLSAITEEERQLLNGDQNINKNLYMENPFSVINGRKLLEKGELITVRAHTRFAHFPAHTHDYVEVVYMCKGQTTHVINGNCVTLREGELLFLPQNSIQEILPTQKDDIAVNFIILPEFFDQSLKMLEEEQTPIKTFIIDCLTNKSSKIDYLHFEVQNELPIQNLVENLIWTLIYRGEEDKRINQTTMGLLFLELLKRTDKLSKITSEQQLVLKVLKYIEENYKDGSLEQLAKNLHYDFAHLSREIKRRAGKTYTQLVQEKRLSKATYLLKNTSINVDEIAEAVGYENASYFHRLFYKKNSCSPKKYRDLYKIY